MNIAWVDLETTGLDVDSGNILEIAVMITDKDLNEIDSYSALVNNNLSIDEIKSKCDAFVLDMHTKNNLFVDLENEPTITINQITEEVGMFLQKNNATGGPMAGNSIGFDRKFVAKHMPALLGNWSYRNLDVSSFKEWFRLSQGFQLEKTESDHRALGDIKASIAEMKQYVGRAL